MTSAERVPLRGRMRLAAGALLAAAAFPAIAELPVPPLTGPVVDQAGLVDPAWRERLESLSRAARAREGGTGVQLQYLLVPSLEGEPIADFSMRVAERWKIGSRGKDDGVLVVVARDDRRMRIEVGAGIEGQLTDVQSGRIIRDTLAPAFRQGRFGEGLYDAGRQILTALGSLPEGVERAPPPGPRRIPIPFVGWLIGLLLAGGTPLILIVVVLAVFLHVLFGLGGGGWGGWGPGSSWGGGGWGSGGGGGGGWSGGGGGFGGGGASGSW